MRRGPVRILAACAILPVVTAACTVPPLTVARAPDPRALRVGFSLLSSGLVAPTAIAFPNDGSGRLFVSEQAGRIRVRTSAGLLVRPYLDIRVRVRDGGERGLLGIAFHPRFANNGFFFVSYTDARGDITLSRFHATPSSNRASPSSEVTFLAIAHRNASNHNGGQVAFGPDGYLYLGAGDGGGAGDPQGNAQNTRTLLGKVLRIDVDRACGGKRYCIPAGNPFATSTTARREIWHFGARNPWRFSFDRATGQQWIADVGQGAREEIDLVPKNAGGRNLGWDCREGTLDTASRYGRGYCKGRTFTPPVYQYGHSGNRCAIIGGYAYRGSAYRSVLEGAYIYGDYCSGEVWALAKQPDGRWLNALVYVHPHALPTFGEGPTGELYAADADGSLFQVTAKRR